MTDENPRYRFEIARFQCGCIHQISSADTPVFCPEHRREWHRGAITGTEVMMLPGPEFPAMDNLVMNPYVRNRPLILRNSERNSLHTETRTMDGKDNEWEETQTELTGLCAACFIDEALHLETRIARCECGDPDCSYRWCGRTEGLHAFWNLHVRGESERATGIPDTDIFAHGPFDDHTALARDALNGERENLRRTILKLTTTALDARQEENPANPRSTFHPAYLNGWLEPDCQRFMNTDSGQEKEWAGRSLAVKLARLHIIGALPPPQAALQQEKA